MHRKEAPWNVAEIFPPTKDFLGLFVLGSESLASDPCAAAPLDPLGWPGSLGVVLGWARWDPGGQVCVLKFHREA